MQDQSSEPGIDELGTFIENVDIDIDQAIIQHFSQHLYSSPHKAIEELVVNGYDAGAGRVNVYLPGEFTSDAVMVFDDGTSMDQAGLHQLWWIARSPKNAPGARSVSGRDVIGKFGIGKLASYALGHKVAHLAHKDGRFLLVEFDFGRLGLVDNLPDGGPLGQSRSENLPPESQSSPSGRSPEPAAALPDTRARIRIPLRELARDEAVEWLSAFFNGSILPDNAAEITNSTDWTAAVVHQLKPFDVSLRAGVLRRVLGNGLPNRPNFAMLVNDQPAVQVLSAKKPTNTLTAKDSALSDQLRSDWAKAVENDVVTGELTIANDGTMNVPGLGEVRLELKTYTDSLLDEASAERGRSHGVFVMVRGRLLNEDDYQHLIQDPSFGTLYRTQIVVYADGLDRVLLADRERLSVASPEAKALREIEQAAYRVARQLVDQEQAEANLEQVTTSLLPTNHRELWHDPLAAYSASRGQPQRNPVADETGEVFDRRPGDANESLASYSSESGRFTVNTAHPFRAQVDERIGGGKKARQLRRVLDVYAVADVLLEGRLLDQGFAGEKVVAAMGWRDDFFREIGRRFGDAPSELQKRAEELSYAGDSDFEVAIRDIFRDMGFDAHQVSGSGKEDVLVVAPIGSAHHIFTIDAKGSKDRVSNLAAHVGGVASHRDAANAEHALIVARDFAGFSNQDEAAVLRECRSVKGVSVVTLGVLFKLHDMMREFFYPLKVVLDLLRPVSTPADYLDSLSAFRRPREGFDYPALLREVWRRQLGTAAREAVFYQAVRQDNNEWKAVVDPGTMDKQMLMLEWASGGLLYVDIDAKTVTMQQSPEIVLRAVKATLDGVGYVHKDDDLA